MTVRELTALLQLLPEDAVILTNECQASSAHEDIVEVTTVARMDREGAVFIGTGTVVASRLTGE